MLRPMGSWDSVYRSGMDSVVRGHWMSYLQMVVVRNLRAETTYYVYIYIVLG